jgi:hypothetical protein
LFYLVLSCFQPLQSLEPQGIEGAEYNKNGANDNKNGANDNKNGANDNKNGANNITKMVQL